jgi:hypothetical protein
MSWQENIGKNLFKNVEVTIGDNTTKVDNIDGKLKIEHYYKDILQKTENEIENEYYYLDKQIYTERELVKNLELIGKHPECIVDHYDTIEWNDDIYDKVIDIVDYIYEDYIKGGQDGLCYFTFIYNNIIVYIEPKGYNDSEISDPYIEYKYVKSQINECDLNAIKRSFNFLNKEMNVD